MAITKPVPVPQVKIESVDVPNFGAGLYLQGDEDAPLNAFVANKDTELDSKGNIIPRRTLTPFLPDTVETTYDKAGMLWNGILYYFTADDGKIKYCQEGDTVWTDCGGSNTITTNNGGMPSFIRVLNLVVLLNGTNGDKVCWADLTSTGFPVTKVVPVVDPATDFGTPTLNGGLTTGAQNIYYAYSYSGTFGETNLSSILTQSIDTTRDQWQAQSTPYSLTLTLPETPPTGAQFWNIYISLAATEGTIQSSDMLQIATGLDLSSTTFIDDGSLSINLGSVAPIDNNTDGPRVDFGVTEEGNPILYGDHDNPQNIWIGGGGQNAMKFTPSNGGYLSQPELGTNFVPTAVIGFRNGQGIPSLTILYSNTEGLSKQAVLEQQTVNYGDQSFVVWATTEQHYGAAGVAATNSTINYNGKLLFLSTDGFMSMNTQPLRQNVISIDPISIKSIDSYVRTIKNSAMNTVVGAGWNNKYMWLVPNAGFDTPQQILILDNNNPGIDGNGAWETLNIPAQWIGVVSPQADAAFVYVSQGTKTFKLTTGTSTYDVINGVNVPFSTGATGSLTGMAGAVHNQWQSNVQAVFDVREIIGSITVGVIYYDQNGSPHTKTATFSGPDFSPSGSGGWGDPGWGYGVGPSLSSTPVIDDSGSSLAVVNKRIVVPIDDIMNEAQWFYSTPVGFNHYKIKSISYEGIALGVKPDLQ